MDTTESIIRAAQKLFARFGFSKTTVDDIAAAAHIAKSTLYHHFTGKEEVFRVVIEREGRMLAEAVAAAVEAAQSPEDQLRAYVVTRLGRLQELANFYTALREEYLEHYAFIESVRERDLREEQEALEQIVCDGAVDGTFRIPGGQVDAVARAFMIALRGLEFPWTLGADPQDLNKHIDILLTVLFNGLLVERAK